LRAETHRWSDAATYNTRLS